MADSETQQPVDSQTPTTWPKQKNTKRVVAGKIIAEKRRQAHDAQKKTVAEAEVMIAKNQLKQTETAATTGEAKVKSESTKNVLRTTQWLSVISIFVSLAGVYYKCKEIKSKTKKKPQNPLPRAPPSSPVEAAATSSPTIACPYKKRGYLRDGLKKEYY